MKYFSHPLQFVKSLQRLQKPKPALTSTTGIFAALSRIAAAIGIAAMAACGPVDSRDIAVPDGQSTVGVPKFGPKSDAHGLPLKVREIRVRAADQDDIVLVEDLTRVTYFNHSPLDRVTLRWHYRFADDLEPAIRAALKSNFVIDPTASNVARINVRLGFTNRFQNQLLCPEWEVNAQFLMRVTIDNGEPDPATQEFSGIGSDTGCSNLESFPREASIANAVQAAFDDLMTRATAGLVDTSR